MNRITMTVLGALLFGLGVLGLILGSIGLSIVPLNYIDQAVSPLLSLIIKLLITIAGVVIFYMSRLDPDEWSE